MSFDWIQQAWVPTFRRPAVIGLLVVGILAPQSLLGLSRSPYFKHLGVREGLSQSWAYCLLQDRQGLIWIGTDNGLNRFDGFDFEVLRHDRDDPGSLADSKIYRLLEDRDGFIWVGMVEGGLDRLDPASGEIVHFAPDPDDPGSLSDPLVSALLQDSDGTIWVGTFRGLDRYDPETGSFQHYRAEGDSESDLPHDSVRALLEDRAGRLWVGTEAGLVELDRESETFTPHRYTDEPLEVRANGGVKAILEDDLGRLWIGTRAGVYEYDPEQGPQRAFHQVPDDPASLHSENIWQIVQDGEGMLWLATHAGGVVRLDPRSGNLETYRHSPMHPSSLSHDRAVSLTIDRTGLLWIGTMGGGLNVWNPSHAIFETYLQDENDSRRPELVDISAIEIVSESVLYLGTRGGLLRFDLDSEQTDLVWSLPGEDPGANEFEIQAVARDDRGFVWFGHSRGLQRVQENTGQVVASLRLPPGDESSTEPTRIHDLLLDRNGMLWVATEKGLARVTPETLEVRVFRADSERQDSLGSDQVWALHEDASGRLWIGTRNGIDLFDPATESFEAWVANSDATGHGTVTTLVSLDSHAIWGGTLSRGLVGLRTGAATVDAQPRRLQIEDGLATDTVNCLAVGRERELWIGSSEGLTRLSPDDLSSFDFTRRDGLLSAGYNLGACARSEQGLLFFGGSTGLTVFDPARVQRSVDKPEVTISKVQLGNEELRANKGQRPIVLEYRDPPLSLAFSVLDYSHPEQNRYRYRLLGPGLGKQWIGSERRREVTFSNLEPGAYTFEVLGSNPEGIWSERAASVSFRVQPAPWRTPAAYLAYLLILGLTLGFWRRGRLRKIREKRQAEQTIRESEERLALALWGGGGGMWEWSAFDGSMFRTRFAEIIGLAEHDLGNDLAAQRERIHPTDRPLVEEAWEEHRLGERSFFEASYRIQHLDGRWIWILERGKAVERDAEGHALRINGTHRDISERMATQSQLRLLAEAFKNTTEGLVVTNAEGEILVVNDAFSAITGYAEDEICGQPATLLDSAKHPESFYRSLRDRVRTMGRFDGELWQVRKDGSEFPAEVRISVLRDSQDEITHLVAIFSDITERRRQEEDLRRLANYDQLTGLPNRTLFDDRLQHALDTAARQKQEVTLMFIDLDRFKQVNDSLGHVFGDKLLQRVARRLADCVRAGDTVARLGGDEFVLLLESTHGLQSRVAVAEKILAEIGRAYDLEGRDITITPSIGITVFPTDSSDAVELMRNADTAMYHAKSEGRNTYQFYTDEMNEVVIERVTLESELRRDLKDDRMRLHFQPRFRLADDAIPSVEALVRWQHPEKGLLAPDTFIPIAEETGLIEELGDWVLRAACDAAARWRKQGREVRVAVNLSARQLRSGNLAQSIREILIEKDLPGSLLELEITETVLMRHVEEASRIFEELKTLGIYISVDDFGTGYSSLSYLKAFPLDSLKVDRSFVRDIDTDPQDAAIVNAIITLAHSLDLGVVAEGVETPAQLEFLRECGCDEVQGYLLARPAPLEDLDWLP